MATRASIYRRWDNYRLATELAKALRRATALAEEIAKRERAQDKHERAAEAEAMMKAKDRETSFMLGHRAKGK